ncbi:hypothetical protein P7K49_001995 [Saguinus oedipus]|uniref:Uncharacterized protein n=1 Tax=Saguinus oedipus TaxID=9490 RepID=A0ABQ9WI18_SAGOE|nr:hypothetical protein P7K49_001995 [Saguinus oedipus]
MTKQRPTGPRGSSRHQHSFVNTVCAANKPGIVYGKQRDTASSAWAEPASWHPWVAGQEASGESPRHPPNALQRHEMAPRKAPHCYSKLIPVTFCAN